MTDPTRPVLIADEVTALGYRLAGARVVEPRQDELGAAFEQALAAAPLVLITAECAARLPARRLARALAATSPLVLVIPDLSNRVPAPDLGARIRSLLGMSP